MKATLIQDTYYYDVSEYNTLQTVRSGPAVLVLEGLSPLALVELDGKTITMVRKGNSWFITLDFTRSVGFHYVVAGDNTLLFVTEDTKLRLAGIMEIVNYIGASSLSHSGQLLFSSGQSIMELTTNFSWLWKHLPKIAATIDDLFNNPPRSSQSATKIANNLKRPIDTAATISLLRRSPYLLEKYETGPIHVSGQSFIPRQVIIKAKRSTLDATATNRALLLAHNCVSIMALLPRSVTKQTKTLLSSARKLENNIVKIRRLSCSPALSATLPLNPTPLELSDPRHNYIFRRYSEQVGRRFGHASDVAGTLSLFVKQSDELYQAFVTLCIAKLLNCVPTREPLTARMRQPAFANDFLEIYYDTEPACVATTWRSETARPDRARPDITIASKLNNTYLLIDAKYRNDGNRASADSLAEVQYYLNTFCTDRAMIIYPPDEPQFSKIISLSSRGQTLFQVPFSPAQDTDSIIKSEIRELILSVLR